MCLAKQKSSKWSTRPQQAGSLLTQGTFGTESEKQRLLDQVSSHDYQAALLRNRKKRHGTTCTWLSRQETYMRWLQAPMSSVFLLSGDSTCELLYLLSATLTLCGQSVPARLC